MVINLSCNIDNKDFYEEKDFPAGAFAGLPGNIETPTVPEGIYKGRTYRVLTVGVPENKLWLYKLLAAIAITLATGFLVFLVPKFSKSVRNLWWEGLHGREIREIKVLTNEAQAVQITNQVGQRVIHQEPVKHSVQPTPVNQVGQRVIHQELVKQPVQPTPVNQVGRESHPPRACKASCTAHARQSGGAESHPPRACKAACTAHPRQSCKKRSVQTAIPRSFWTGCGPSGHR